MPYAARIADVVEHDPLNLNLKRYLADLAPAPWPEGSARIPNKTLVVASIRTQPQFIDDLQLVAQRLRGAERGTVVMLCLEDAFEAAPVPALAEGCERNGWRIVRIADLPMTRIRSSLLVEVEGEDGADRPDDSLRLHNALVLADDERRRLRERLESALADRRPIAVVRPSTEETSTAARIRQELEDLRRHVEELERARDRAEEGRRGALEQLRRLQASGTVLIGRALVQAPRKPKQLLRLPVDILRHARRREAHQAATGPSSTESVGSPVARTPVTAAATAVASSPDAPARVLADPARLRVATVAGRSLVERLRAGADVVTVPAGGWLGQHRSHLGVADVLLVEASVGSGSGAWRSLGEPGEVERTSELVALLETAESLGLPSVLLVRDGRVPAGLRGLEGRFSAVLPQELGPNGWDPGVPLDQLPWPAEGERARPPVHLMEGPGLENVPRAGTQWLSAFRPLGLQRWLVGADALVDERRSGITTVRLPSMPFVALSKRAFLVAPGGNDTLAVAAGLAAGCGVMAREPIEEWTGGPGVTIAENPLRARSLLEAGPSPMTPGQVLEVRRRLLDHGATQERVLSLADLLDLPITRSLRNQIGLTVLAHVRDRTAGETLARGILAQTRHPCDIVVATGEPRNAEWLQELCSSGVPVSVYGTSAPWWQLTVIARRNLVAVWLDGGELDPTEVADVELLHRAPDRVGSAHAGSLTPFSRSTLMACMEPVAHGLPRIGDAT
jgi:hypothetical protein